MGQCKQFLKLSWTSTKNKSNILNLCKLFVLELLIFLRFEHAVIFSLFFCSAWHHSALSIKEKVEAEKILLWLEQGFLNWVPRSRSRGPWVGFGFTSPKRSFMNWGSDSADALLLLFTLKLNKIHTKWVYVTLKKL